MKLGDHDENLAPHFSCRKSCVEKLIKIEARKKRFTAFWHTDAEVRK